MAGCTKGGSDMENFPCPFRGATDIVGSGDVPADNFDSLSKEGPCVGTRTHQPTHLIPNLTQPPGEVSPGEAGGSCDEDDARPIGRLDWHGSIVVSACQQVEQPIVGRTRTANIGAKNVPQT